MIGMANAAVLPLPVFATPTTELLRDKSGGMQALCTGVGCLIESPFIVPRRRGSRPKPSKDCSSEIVFGRYVKSTNLLLLDVLKCEDPADTELSPSFSNTSFVENKGIFSC